MDKEHSCRDMWTQWKGLNAGWRGRRGGAMWTLPARISPPLCSRLIIGSEEQVATGETAATRESVRFHRTTQSSRDRKQVRWLCELVSPSPTFKFGADVCQLLVYPLYLGLFTFTCRQISVTQHAQSCDHSWIQHPAFFKGPAPAEERSVRV